MISRLYWKLWQRYKTGPKFEYDASEQRRASVRAQLRLKCEGLCPPFESPVYGILGNGKSKQECFGESGICNGLIDLWKFRAWDLCINNCDADLEQMGKSKTFNTVWNCNKKGDKILLTVMNRTLGQTKNFLRNVCRLWKRHCAKITKRHKRRWVLHVLLYQRRTRL